MVIKGTLPYYTIIQSLSVKDARRMDKTVCTHVSVPNLNLSASTGIVLMLYWV
jgi:hypothetical protein